MHAPQGSDLISMVRAKLCDKPIYDAVREADVTPENFIFKTNAQIYLSMGESFTRDLTGALSCFDQLHWGLSNINFPQLWQEL